MKIIEITRDPKGCVQIPAIFRVGDIPQRIAADGSLENEPDCPPVKHIRLWADGAYGNKAIRGLVYLIKFEETDIRTLIPMDEAIEVRVDSEESSKAENAADSTPELPGGD